MNPATSTPASSTALPNSQASALGTTQFIPTLRHPRLEAFLENLPTDELHYVFNTLNDQAEHRYTLVSNMLSLLSTESDDYRPLSGYSLCFDHVIRSMWRCIILMEGEINLVREYVLRRHNNGSQ